MGAEPIRVSVALVARDAVFDELVADRGRGLLDVLGDFRDGKSAADEELNSVTYVYDHVLHVFHVRSCGTRHRDYGRWRIGYLKPRLSETKRTFPPRGGRHGICLSIKDDQSLQTKHTSFVCLVLETASLILSVPF